MEYKKKNTVMRVVLSLIILVLAIVILFINKQNSQAHVTGIGINYNSHNLEGSISVCINEVIQREEWISPEEGEPNRNFDLFIRRESDDIESVLFRIVPLSTGEEEMEWDISSISFYVNNEVEFELFKTELSEALDISASSSCLIQQDGIVIKDLQVGEPIYLRIKKATIDELKGRLEVYKEENKLKENKAFLYSFLKLIIILSVCLFWINLLYDRIYEFFRYYLFSNKNDSNHYKWLYHIRGMAIIAVVVCHQQHFLHDTEWIQMISLYSVTTFIFCMGLTKGIVLKKNKLYKESYLQYLIHSLKGVFVPYLIASIAYLVVNGSFTNWNLLSALVNFNASGPLYFIWYVVIFSLMAPILFEVSSYINNKYEGIKCIVIYIFFLVSLFMIGYSVDIFGSTYLLVYAAGMIVSILGFPKYGWKLWLVSAVCLAVGTINLINYYFRFFELKFSLDYLIPKVSINPPNFTVMFYSFSCILFFYCLFNSRIFKKLKPIDHILAEMGKYSLDIFIWHLLIQHFFIVKNFNMGSIWIKRVVVYSAMFFIPILCRKLWIYTKRVYSNVLLQHNR